MNSPEALFRREALESWSRGRDRAGAVVRLSSPWRAWLYRLTIVLVLAGCAALWIPTTEEQATGPAVVDPATGSVTALLPAASAPGLPRSQGLRVDLPGDGRGPVPVDGVHARQADDAALRRTGLRPPSQPAILLTGRLRAPFRGSASPVATVHADASVLLRSERVVDLLARQFGTLLGHGEGAS